MKLEEKIPDCQYWEFRGSLIGCEILGVLCLHDRCDIEKYDPTGFLRKRIDDRKREEWRKVELSCRI